MYLRSFLIIIFVSLLVACTHHSNLPTSNKETRPLPSFNCVRITGVFNVNLHTGHKRSKVMVRGNPQDLEHVLIKVKNGVLIIRKSRHYRSKGPVELDIYTHYLNSVEYHGKGLIIAHNLHSRMLDLNIDNKGSTSIQGKVTLNKVKIKHGFTEIKNTYSPCMSLYISGKATVEISGVVNITHIEIAGYSRLRVLWVKSRRLIIRGHGRGIIQLAGVANKIDVELWDHSRYNGRYLRARRAFIKTHNESLAEVSAVAHQHTLATGASDIRFYNLPTMRADFMADNGAVLDMRDLGIPFLQEPTRYNKYVTH